MILCDRSVLLFVKEINCHVYLACRDLSTCKWVSYCLSFMSFVVMFTCYDSCDSHQPGVYPEPNISMSDRHGKTFILWSCDTGLHVNKSSATHKRKQTFWGLFAKLFCLYFQHFHKITYIYTCTIFYILLQFLVRSDSVDNLCLWSYLDLHSIYNVHVTFCALKYFWPAKDRSDRADIVERFFRRVQDCNVVRCSTSLRGNISDIRLLMILN